MNTSHFRILVRLGFGLLSLAVVPLGWADGSYHFVKEIAIGGDGGWDYLSVDSAAHRLFVTHGTKVVVVDTTTDQVVGEVADTPGVHGFAVAPGLGLGFASNGRENKVSRVDLKTLQTLGKVETGENPDAILFAAGAGEVYAFNGRGQSATVFEAATGKVVATVPLGGKPEFAQEDAAAGRIFVNLEDKNEVIVLDAKTHQITAHWPIAPGEEATGLAIDLALHRLVLGCGNEKMIVLDSTDGHVVAALAAGKGIDATAFDPGTQLAFASAGGSGNVTIVHEDAPDKFTVVQTLATERSARTMTLDPATGPRQRPKMVPGTFKVLVYAPN